MKSSGEASQTEGFPLLFIFRFLTFFPFFKEVQGIQ